MRDDPSRTIVLVVLSAIAVVAWTRAIGAFLDVNDTKASHDNIGELPPLVKSSGMIVRPFATIPKRDPFLPRSRSKPTGPVGDPAQLASENNFDTRMSETDETRLGAIVDGLALVYLESRRPLIVSRGDSLRESQVVIVSDDHVIVEGLEGDRRVDFGRVRYGRGLIEFGVGNLN